VLDGNDLNTEKPSDLKRKRIYDKKLPAYNKKVRMGPRAKVYAQDFGKYPPHCRLNVDQGPFQLDNQARKGFVPHKGADHVQISGPTGGNKRFGTIQVCLHGGTRKFKQPKMCMFFKGAGNAMAAEEHAYHPNVEVIFQPKAWFDKTVATKWIDRVLKPWREKNIPGQEFILSQDNLGDQKDPHHNLHMCFLFAQAPNKNKFGLLF
jgi:hypothetical protein